MSKKWANRNKVLCTNCGFLYWEYYNPNDGTIIKTTECTSYWRKRIQNNKDLGSQEDPETGLSIDIACMRKQWDFTPNIKVMIDNKYTGYKGIDELIQPIKCSFYTKYQPGFSPIEHKELLRDFETNKTIFKAGIIGAVIGASAAIIAQILYIVFLN